MKSIRSFISFTVDVTFEQSLAAKNLNRQEIREEALDLVFHKQKLNDPIPQDFQRQET